MEGKRKIKTEVDTKIVSGWIAGLGREVGGREGGEGKKKIANATNSQVRKQGVL